MNIWRAPTDNDGLKSKATDEQKDLSRWLAAGLHQLTSVVNSIEVIQAHPQIAIIAVRTRIGSDSYPTAFVHQHTYTVSGDGELRIENEVTADPDLPNLPRVGLTMTLPGGFEQVAWFGKGPHENYADRSAGAAVGVYRGTVDDQYVPYIMPQENGNKTAVRWLTLTHNNGTDIQITGDALFEFSVHHFTAGDFFQARHTNELVRRDQVILNLDHKQSGLGGHSCGPATLPQYRIDPGLFRFGFVITRSTAP